jgi:hypothetical protein
MSDGKFMYRIPAEEEEAFIREFESVWTDEQLDLVTSGFKGTGLAPRGDARLPETVDPRTDPLTARNILLNPTSTIAPSERPFVLPLLAYLDAAGEKIPADVRLLSRQCLLYLLKYSIDAQPSERERFTNVELRLDYGGGGPIVTHSMTPDTTFEKRVAASVNVKAALDPHLKFKPTDLTPIPGVSVGGGIELGADSEFLLQFEYRPVVAKIVALGTNSSFARWIIEKPERLVGNIPFAIVMRVPHGTRQIALTVKGSYRLERGLWWWQRETTVEFATPDPIVVELPDAG